MNNFKRDLVQQCTAFFGGSCGLWKYSVIEITAGRENLKLPHFTLTKYRKRVLKKKGKRCLKNMLYCDKRC